ncbi:M16 family metallopeptidase [Parapedobacter tibetensis]|uniref:M16 family metallopeptidase n=1 Tax=Parapedobacter tibetensis TaxID=2972951 RepID=UPI00214DC388|nr:pitrilysin family protein [Parapedobacter tibetensis]
MLDRTSPPVYNAIERFNLIKPEHITFANGMEVFVFNAGEQDLVRIEWIFGNVFTEEKQALLNTCACEMLLEGTSSYSSTKIAETVDFHGAFLVPEFGYDRSALSLFTLNKHLAHLLPLAKAVLSDSVFPENELATYTRNSKQKLQVALEKNSFVARRQFNNAVFGQTRYGHVFEIADYDKITREALLALFRQQYTPSNCTLIISGKVTDDVVASLERLFGDDWTDDNKSAPADIAPDFGGHEGRVIVAERKDSLQSAIRLGCLSLQRHHEDFPGMQVVNTLLGGYFGSRLMANIREDKGYTYSIGSGLASLKHRAFFTIASEVGVDMTTATLTEIEREIRLLRDEKVSEEELALVKNYMLGSMLGSLENVFSHADKFKSAYFSGLDLDYYEYYTGVVRNIDADEIHRLANAYLDYDRMVKVVVGRMI